MAPAKSSNNLQVNQENGDIREILKQRGPGYPLFHVFSSESSTPVNRATAILAHLAVVLGMVLIGYRHFDNTHTGIAAATLYLLLPYTANFTSRIDHVVPAALLVWAIQAYRRPVLAGIFVGLAAGTASLQLGGAGRAGDRGCIVGFHAVKPGVLQGSVLPNLRRMARTQPRHPWFLGGSPIPIPLAGYGGFCRHVREHGLMACPEESRQPACLFRGNHARLAVLEGL